MIPSTMQQVVMISNHSAWETSNALAQLGSGAAGLVLASR